jgi:hypothetical protein
MADEESTASIRLANCFAEVKINAIALANLNTTVSTPIDGDDVQEWRHATLMRCLQSSKAFFDAFFSLPVAEYGNMGTAEKSRLVLTLTILAKLCLDIPSVPRWDSGWARKEAQFGMIIESLCYRTQELTQTGKCHDTDDATLPPDYFYMMKSVLEILKDVYGQAVDKASQAAEAECPEAKKRSKCPMLNGDIMTTDFWASLEFSQQSGVDPLLDGNWNLNDSSTWNWDWAEAA